MTTNTRARRPVAAALAALVAMTLLLVAPAADAAPAAPAKPAAPAVDAWCVATGDLCGRVINSSGYSVLAAKNWGSKSPQSWLSPGSSTPRWEDWDAFRIDAGWCYKFIIWQGPVPTWHTWDRRGMGSAWYQIHDHQSADVYFQSTTSC